VTGIVVTTIEQHEAACKFGEIPLQCSTMHGYEQSCHTT
jgi:hypothetical protein